MRETQRLIETERLSKKEGVERKIERVRERKCILVCGEHPVDQSQVVSREVGRNMKLGLLVGTLQIIHFYRVTSIKVPFSA